MNPKSNIKTFLYSHTLSAVKKYLGCSLQTLHNWQKRGYAQPSQIPKLAKFPNSIMTEAEFLQDIKDNKK